MEHAINSKMIYSLCTTISPETDQVMLAGCDKPNINSKKQITKPVIKLAMVY